MKTTVNIKVASDVVCPWCYIGKKHLEKAIELLKEDYFVEVQYLPFELAPDVPESGADFKTHISQKFGDWNQFLKRSEMVKAKGQPLGIDFKFEQLGNTPNTFQIHRVIQFAHQLGLQVEVVDAFFKSYFVDLVDLTNESEVIRIAASAGLDAEHVATLLKTKEGYLETRSLQDNVLALGITGVPFFIINDQFGLSGAVPAEQLVEAIKQASPISQDGENCNIDEVC